MNRKSIISPKSIKILALIFLLIAVSLYILTIVIYNFGRQQNYSGHADAIIVAGCHVDKIDSGYAPSLYFQSRLSHAKELYSKKCAKYIIISGGIDKGADKSEAEVGKDFLISTGVPENAIICEDKSTSTYSNAINCAEISYAKGIKNIILVTERYHIFRAKNNFEKAGFIVYASSAPNTIVDDNFYQRTFFALFEIIKITRDILYGRF
jgi:uncharacterized SAM-binding protein YcdF (DUF218 family)